MNFIKRATGLLLVAVMLFAVVIGTAVPASAAAFTIQRQWDSKWKSYYVGGRTMYDTACGIFSMVNAIGYLTGDAPEVYSAAKWANSIGAFNAGFGGTDRSALYPKIQKKYGATYGFTCDVSSGSGYWAGSSSTKLKNHLANGGVAIGHVPGHFIAIVGYDPNTNYFHVYDSAPSSSRGTNSYGATGYGDCWVTQSRLATGKLKLDWFCLLSSTKAATPAKPESYNALGGLITETLDLICVDYTYSQVCEVRSAYTNAVSVYNNTASADADYQAAYNTLYAAIHPTSNIVSIGKSYTSTNTRSDSYADDQKRLTDGTKGGRDGGINYSGWQGNAEIIVDLGREIETNTFSVYLAGGAWGISTPIDTVKLSLCWSQDGVNYYPLAESDKAVLKGGSGIVVDGEDSWSTYKITISTGPVWAQYIKFSLNHVDGGHIWMDEVEIAKYDEPFLTDKFYVNGFNGTVKSGQCMIYTNGFGEITAEKANHRWTTNIIATKQADGSFIVDEVFQGNGDDVKSVTLTEHQIMIAAHSWEGATDSVVGSAHNTSFLGTARPGDIIMFNGVTTALGYYDVLAYGSITYKTCSHNYTAVVTAPTCNEPGYTTYTCGNCGDSYASEYVPAVHTPGASADCTHDQTCTVCGVVINNAYGHTEGEWETLSDGSQEQRCVDCGTILATKEAEFELGDVNGDGKINMFDYMLLKSIYLGKHNPSDVEFARGDINKDGKLNMFDYIAVKSVCMA